MLKNYLVTAFRSLWKEKNKNTLNILGLTIGIASSLALFLIIRHHNSFDRFHSKGDRIYRVVTMSDGNNGKDYTGGIPAVLPDAFRNDFHEAEEVVFTSYRANSMITIPQGAGEPKRYEEERGTVFTQSNFFNVFDRKIIKGKTENCLDNPNEAVISKKAALKYFNKEDAIGEVFEFEKIPYKVTAIMEDTPDNTDLPFELMLSLVTKKKDFEKQGWHSIWSDEHCYLTLKKGATPQEVERRMPDFVKKYIGEGDKNRSNQTFALQPLSTFHFDDRFGNYNYNTVSESMLVALTAIAVLLIVTACINFVNLSTAEAIKRSKEVGIRKSLGSTRNQLIAQFLGEATVVTIISVVLALLFTQFSLRFINSFLNLHLTLDFSEPIVIAFIVGLTIVVSLLSGLYPSFVVSGFQPAFAMKNKIGDKNSSGYFLRRGLVVLQFIISQTLIIGTIVLINQMDYFRNKDLGFRKDAILTLPVPVREEPADSAKVSRARTLRNEVSQLKNVEMASLNSAPPSSGMVMGSNFSVEGSDNYYETQIKAVDSSYVHLFELNLVAGKNIFDYDTAQGFLVNEKLATMTGFHNPQDMVGKVIKVWGKQLPVVGVVNDFHTVSLRDPVEATILMNRIRNYKTLAVRISPVNMQETIKEIQKKWEALYPDFIFSYQFLDESIREFYDGEQRASTMLTVFTSLAILIGCLGLFGLASFMANQKTKEIGVRKVMGASVQSIVMLFTKEFASLIVIGFVVASPLAWYLCNQWLSQFTYRISLGPIIFAVGLIVTFLIAMFTVGYRSFRAASANPVDSLKYE